MAGLNFAQLRDHLGTFSHGDWATWVEDTSRRRVQRTRYLSAQHDAFPVGLHLRARNRHRRQQRSGVGVQGIVVEPLAVGHFHDLAEIHHCHPVGDVADDGEVVGDE
jgi:hypothetical protein